MEPFLFTIINVVALNHCAKTHSVAQAVPGFVGVNGVALIVYIFHLLRHLAFVFFGRTSLLLRRRFPLANGAVTAAASRTHNAGGWALSSFARLLELRDWRVASRAGTPRSINGQRRLRFLAGRVAS